MDDNYSNTDRRVGARIPPDQYYSVQFRQIDLSTIYQFKIWNISTKGMCILVRQDSNMMSCLNVDDTLDMEYYSDKKEVPAENIKTHIRHITKIEDGRFNGHYLVGLGLMAS
jgi:hypothetical protein